MKPIIIVESVSKKFNKGAKVHSKYGIRDLFNEILGRNRDIRLRQDEFNAVDNLTFALYPGDTLALIGRNGCGKTTSLNMINGTLKPDAGRIIIDGRVQALIAMGAGFDPRLSGKENIFNAAAVLGLNRKETTAIIDEIVDFAELDDFINNPVQTYSSGMYARLGFSVAVHLKPEILIIDEILSVGDYSFQNKCFNKMQQLKNDGVTIVLVSHAHTRVVQLCDQAIWLHKGKTIKVGTSKEVVKAYLSFLSESEAKKLKKSQPVVSQERIENKKKHIQTIYGPFIYDSREHIDNIYTEFYVNNRKVDSFKIHKELIIEYGFTLKHRVENLSVNLPLYRKEDGLEYGKITTINDDLVKHIHEEKVKCRVTLSDFFIVPGTYILVMAVFEGHSFLYRNIVKEFVVQSNGDLVWGLVGFKCKHEVL